MGASLDLGLASLDSTLDPRRLVFFAALAVYAAAIASLLYIGHSGHSRSVLEGDPREC